MSDDTFVKIFRSSVNHRYFSNVNLWHFYQYCILKASKYDHEQLLGFQNIRLEPGQFIFGREKASRETGLTEQSIRTCLGVLKRDGKITIKSTSKYSIITVVKFSTWQKPEQPINQQINQQITSNQPASNQQVTSKQPTSNQQVTTNKNKDFKNLSSEALRLSNKLVDLILRNYPENISLRNGKRESKVFDWAGDIDKLNRIDGVAWDTVEAVLTWSQEDAFWQKNILSGDKLRKQFDQLRIKMESSRPKQQTPPEERRYF